MSESRKILTAKRKNERKKNINFEDHERKTDNNFRKGIKRPTPITPKKNLANDRMKRLRTSLNEEAQNSESSSNKTVANARPKRQTNASLTNNIRKRPPTVESPGVSETKMPRNYNVDISILLKSSSTNSFSNETIFTGTNSENINETSIFAANIQNSCPETYSQSTSGCDVMEWSPNDEDIQPTVSNMLNPTSSDATMKNKLNHFPSNSKSNSFYIVTDTNIFLSQMKLVRTIVDMNIAGSRKPVIFIPWIVIEELDFIKEDCNKNSLKWKAQEAIKYIEATLTSKNERVMGQTLNQVNEQKDVGKGQDNKIIACCLQVLEKYQNMVLLTDDVNLRNKARINHIPACSNREIISKISETPLILPLDDKKFKLILGRMTSLCKTVIQECAIKAYGQAAHKMQICQNVPQSLQDCIKIFLKYWFPVFQEVLMKQFKKSIDDLSIFLTNNETINDDSNQLNELLRLCVRVCVFLKDVSSCKNVIENTIRDLNNIKET